MLTIYDIPIENRIRLAVSILSYSIIKSGRFHYSDSWYNSFLNSMERRHNEILPEIKSSTNPVICYYCGKVVGANKEYAAIKRPQFEIDCCFKKCFDILSPTQFTIFTIMPVIDIINYRMKIPRHYIMHYGTLEAMKYFASKERQINELSRYYVKPAINAGFETISSLSCAFHIP